MKGMRLDEYRTMQALSMPERSLQEQVRQMCRQLGIRFYHTHTSRFSPRGFPDCVMVSPPKLMFRELKRQTAKPTKEQQQWLVELRACGVDAGVWRPLDLLNGRIARELRAMLPGRESA